MFYFYRLCLTIGVNRVHVLILGAGNIGKAIAYDLSRDFEVSVGDLDKDHLREAKKYGTPLVVDAQHSEDLIEKLNKFDLVIDALPGNLGFKTLQTAIKAKKDIVSVSFMPENPLQLQQEAIKAQTTIVPDAGFAPGISNLCMGILSHEFESFESAMIRVGGLPKQAKPPLNYRVTWSPNDLIEEYTRKARIVKNGEVIKVDPLKEIEQVKIKEWEFDEFTTDGLRTLLDTIDAKHLEERTLRWKGHLEKIKVLRQLGFFKKQHRKFTLNVLLPHLTYDTKDFSIMQIIGRGYIGGEKKEVRYLLYDEEKTFTSMARTTGFTAAIIARLVGKNEVPIGVHPPETFDVETINKVISQLKSREITIDRTVSIG